LNDDLRSPAAASRKERWGHLSDNADGKTAVQPLVAGQFTLQKIL